MIKIFKTFVKSIYIFRNCDIIQNKNDPKAGFYSNLKYDMRTAFLKIFRLKAKRPITKLKKTITMFLFSFGDQRSDENGQSHFDTL